MIFPVSPTPPSPKEEVAVPDIMGMLDKSFKKAQTKSTKSESPVDNILNGNIQRMSPVHKTPGKKLDLNTLFNTFTPIKPASPVIQQEQIPTPAMATPIDFTKTAALRNIMGLDSKNKPPWPETNSHRII